MKKYYFTFGSEGQLFKGGWVTVLAENYGAARDLFAMYYGKRAYHESGFLNFAFQYDEEMFAHTGMAKDGNLGAFCHETIGG